MLIFTDYVLTQLNKYSHYKNLQYHSVMYCKKRGRNSDKQIRHIHIL